jgi:hypothetical protein
MLVILYDNFSSMDKKNFIDVAIELIDMKYKKKQKRDIWSDSKWKYISELENDDIGKVGEEIIHNFCHISSISAFIDGSKSKYLYDGCVGDGFINSKSVEIKTARLSSNGVSFQHELGETPINQT